MKRFGNWVTCWLAVTMGVVASARALPLLGGQPLSSRMDDLGFDRIPLVQRHPVEASHPYTCFYISTSYDTLAMGRQPAPPHRFVGQNALVENPYTHWISGFHGVEQDILEIWPRRWGSPRSELAEVVPARATIKVAKINIRRGLGLKPTSR